MGLSANDEFTVAIVFLRNRGLIASEDSLEVNGQELAGEAVASPDQCTIAVFLYDGNADGESGGNVLAPFNSFPFLNAVDVHIAADPEDSFSARLNGRTVHAPRWPSDSEGPVVIVFDSELPGQ